MPTVMWHVLCCVILRAGNDIVLPATTVFLSRALGGAVVSGQSSHDGDPVLLIAVRDYPKSHD